MNRIVSDEQITALNAKMREIAHYHMVTASRPYAEANMLLAQMAQAEHVVETTGDTKDQDKKAVLN